MENKVTENEVFVDESTISIEKIVQQIEDHLSEMRSKGIYVDEYGGVHNASKEDFKKHFTNRAMISPITRQVVELYQVESFV